MFCESRRVENDEIESAVGRFLCREVFEGICRDGCVVVGLREVVRHISVDEINRFLADIDRIDALGASTQGIEGETAGVAEHVEHLFAFGVTLDECAVLALVDEEAGLLPAQPVDTELQAVLHGPELFCVGNRRLGVGYQVAHFVSQDGRLEGQGVVGLIIDVFDLWNAGDDGLRDSLATTVHADGVRLHDGRIGIDVDDESRQEITFTMDEPVGVVVGSDESQRLPYGIGGANTLMPEIGGQAVDAKRQDANGDRADLPMADTQQLVGRGAHLDEVALLGLTVWVVPIERDTCNSPAEDPRMASEQRFFFMRF